jgi:hypothetical protein
MDTSTVLGFIRIVVPGIIEVRDTRNNTSHMFKGWSDEDDQFTLDTTPDGELIEVFLEYGETGSH